MLTLRGMTEFWSVIRDTQRLSVQITPTPLTAFSQCYAFKNVCKILLNAKFITRFKG
jgi:hypothetical protein